MLLLLVLLFCNLFMFVLIKIEYMWLIDCAGKAIFGEKEWYFFSPRDRKYPNGSRPNRVAGSGYWKATGTDKIITTEGRKVGIKKALVFYVGKAPKGTKTNWIMHEYRLLDSSRKNNGSAKVNKITILILIFRIVTIDFTSSKIKIQQLYKFINSKTNIIFIGTYNFIN